MTYPFKKWIIRRKILVFIKGAHIPRDYMALNIWNSLQTFPQNKENAPPHAPSQSVLSGRHRHVEHILLISVCSFEPSVRFRSYPPPFDLTAWIYHDRKSMWLRLSYRYKIHTQVKQAYLDDCGGQSSLSP